ncbi:glutamic acid-rich protein-like isoform X1 [Rhopalosiphum padi]|uniref:glutamic acid-rich protein-like isoform X1 n=1 Tax=Rhopalosiphum padi TaxID=40932 RepID=UPI00298D89F2|nr:glutamic acid-rich protein-like isoform X1 [Rhopalosiphum padi]
MDFETSYRNSAAARVCDVRFVWLMLIAVVAECTGSERTTLQLSNYSSGYYPQHFVLIDPWVSPSLKNTNVAVYKKNNGKSEESIGGIKKVDAEKHKSGKLFNEKKSTNYKEDKGDDDKYNDKGGHAGEIHTHGGKKKEASYKKGDKGKKFKTKKGFRDKYHKNEKHKVNEYWDNYETYGTFKKFGKKGDKKLLGNKKSKKNKTKKGGQSNKENHNKGETKHKSGKKGEIGHKEEKHSDTHYNHKSKYHKGKKSKKNHKKNT